MNRVPRPRLTKYLVFRGQDTITGECDANLPQGKEICLPHARFKGGGIDTNLRS